MTTTVQPKQTELSIQYSVGVKATIGGPKSYENANVNLSRSERYSVEGMTQEEINRFFLDRYEELRTDLGKSIEFEYEELKS